MDNLKIAIFDHIGKKSGMNYYDVGLMTALSVKVKQALVFSNYIGINSDSIKYYRFFDGFSNENRIKRFIRFISATFRSSLKAKKISCDLVIVHVFSFELVFLLAVLIPKIFGLRIAMILHDVSSFRKNDNRLYKYIINNYLCNYIVIHNQYSYDEFITTENIKDNDKVHIIKHGGYLDFRNGKNRIKDNNSKLVQQDKSKKYILFFGQIKEVKGLDILLKAMQDINKDIILIIAGRINKDEFKQYDHLIDNYHISDRIIKINKYIEHNELLELFRLSKMVILPYKKIYQSGVLLMAMSFKLPVLASDLDPINEIITDNINGLLFNNFDTDDLIIKINRNIKDTKKLKLIAENAFQTIVKRYSWDDIANDYIKLLEN